MNLVQSLCRKKVFQLSFIFGFFMALSAPSLWADAETERLLMGVLNLPQKSWTLGAAQTRTSPTFKDETLNTNSYGLQGSYGLTPWLTLEAQAETEAAFVDTLEMEEYEFEAEILILKAPFQVAVFGEYGFEPAENEDKIEVGGQVLKNMGQWSLLGSAQKEFEKSPGSGRAGEVEGSLGLYHRLGLTGLLGLNWKGQEEGEHELQLHIAGALNNHLFLTVIPGYGLTEKSTDHTLQLNLSYYFGEFALASWAF